MTEATGAQLPPSYDPEVSPAEFHEKIILKPAEVEHVWNSDNPKQLMGDMVTRLIREKVNKHGSEWNRHSPFENRWEKAECQLIGEFCLQALVFARGEAKIADSYTVGAITNTFFDLLLTFEKSDGSFRLEQRKQLIQDVVKTLFTQKRLTRDQVKQVLEFAQRTAFRHISLLELTFSKKREFTEKNIRVTLSEPKIMGNLESKCKEIVEEKEEASRSQQDFYQADEAVAQAAEDAHQQTQISDQPGEIHVDPEDPLYGLEQRLKNMNLDDESRKIIREKLNEANDKIKFALEERQKNLDTKLAGGAAAAGAPKKK